jgi:hypothetical protein
MKIVKDYNPKNKDEVSQAEVDAEINNELKDVKFDFSGVERRDFEGIVQKAEQNAKCEIDFDSVKIEGNPNDVKALKENDERSFHIEYDNPDNGEFFDYSKKVFEMAEMAVKVLKENRSDNEDEDGEDRIKYPLDRIKEQMNKLSTKMINMTYVTICQMYEGVLVDEKLTLRKGRAYEYKHQGEVDRSTFFELFTQNKQEVYKKLGFEKSILAEELIKRLIDLGIYSVREREIWSRDNKEYIKESYFKLEDTYSQRDPEWIFNDEALKDELARIDSLIIRFKNPLKIVNQKTPDSISDNECLIVKGMMLKNSVDFIGSIAGSGEEEETYPYDRELELNRKVYNYLYRYYEDIIKNVLCKAEYLMKKHLLKRMTYAKIMEEKCSKYLLVAGIMGIKMND